MNIVKAPESNYLNSPRPYLFLAGSIEMGAAEQWQAVVEEALSSYSGTILNPRRDDWDSSWEQTIESEQFREQVEWELDALDESDLVFVYFDPATKSPITLLELGYLTAKPARLVVCCPGKFWRRGNVEILCKRMRVDFCETLYAGIALVSQAFHRIGNMPH